MAQVRTFLVPTRREGKVGESSEGKGRGEAEREREREHDGKDRKYPVALGRPCEARSWTPRRMQGGDAL